MGGQTALNLAKEAEELGIWEKYNVRLIGVDIKAIDKEMHARAEGILKKRTSEASGAVAGAEEDKSGGTQAMAEGGPCAAATASDTGKGSGRGAGAGAATGSGKPYRLRLSQRLGSVRR